MDKKKKNKRKIKMDHVIKNTSNNYKKYKKFSHLSQLLIICNECRKNMEAG